MRVVIAGAGGGVGASLAFNLLLSELECEVVMVDARQNMVHSHLWDLEQVLEQTGPTPAHPVRSGSVDDIAGADCARHRRRGATHRQQLANGVPARQRGDRGAPPRCAPGGMAGHA